MRGKLGESSKKFFQARYRSLYPLHLHWRFNFCPDFALVLKKYLTGLFFREILRKSTQEKWGTNRVDCSRELCN